MASANERKGDPDVTVLDVRGDDEFKHGNVRGAKHIYVPHLEELEKIKLLQLTVAVVIALQLQQVFFKNMALRK